jgi:hypothetical protein
MKIKRIKFNEIEYQVSNEIVFDDVHYYLIVNEDKTKIVYKLGDEYFQLIKNDNYKTIIDKLCSNIKD